MIGVSRNIPPTPTVKRKMEEVKEEGGRCPQ